MEALTKEALSVRSKWIEENPKQMARFQKEKDVVLIINSLAMVVSKLK